MMSALDSVDSLLFSLSRAFCSPLAVFVQIQGCTICLLLALGWILAAYVRYREIKRMKNGMKQGNSFVFLCQDINELEHSNQVQLPGVSVVMPLKGFGEHNLHNWKSQQNIPNSVNPLSGICHVTSLELSCNSFNRMAF
ncbi:hypothetical protein SAY86_013629 [Trapa natans]|uniref:Uncharacterized protein n=1 Tax=Trapa natans TaxID=22666 RepID=A0AAN7KUX5_TRANT|nr:hypothetical protein SAY86_013629 [Trapa natans]